MYTPKWDERSVEAEGRRLIGHFRSFKQAAGFIDYMLKSDEPFIPDERKFYRAVRKYIEERSKMVNRKNRSCGSCNKSGSRRKSHRELHFAGYTFDAGPTGTSVRRDRIQTNAPGDYGADPIGDGTFRMVPSGDIVSYEERNRRLRNRSGFIPGTKIPVSTHAHPTVEQMKRGGRRVGVPSVKAIMSRLGPGLVHEFGAPVARIKAHTIHQIMKTDPSNHRGEGLRAINLALNAHGVEYIAQRPGELNQGEWFEYVNMGDTYTPTVIHYRGKYRLESWGELVERLERRGKRFQ